jgi:DNA adenine methylase
MKYMGSKSRFAKQFLPIILDGRTSDQWYVEPFAGGMNVIDKVPGLRIAADSNPYLIAMWKSLINGWTPPTEISRDDYNAMRSNPSKYEPDLVGWVGFIWSFRGKFFGGYTPNKSYTRSNGKTENNVDEQQRNILKQLRNNVDEQQRNSCALANVKFIHSTYEDLDIPANSIIYCDPPYAGTTGYNLSFDHSKFWEWCRIQSRNGHKLYVSEYSAPDDFKCIWSKQTSTTLGYSTSNFTNKSFTRIERLFVQ